MSVLGVCKEKMVFFTISIVIILEKFLLFWKTYIFRNSYSEAKYYFDFFSNHKNTRQVYSL